MREKANIEAIDALYPDLIGFIFYEGSSRYVGESDLSFPTQAQKVGVFVQASIEDILVAVQKFDLAYIQLHGGEDLDYIKELRKYVDAHFIKAFSIDENFDFESIRKFEEHCSCFLFDTKGEKHGGNGTKFNWNILEKYNSSHPYMLSGGIRPEDAPILVELARKYPALRGVDINSGFEILPALKDTTAIKAFKELLSADV